jgi:hypothetical protein
MRLTCEDFKRNAIAVDLCMVASYYRSKDTECYIQEKKGKGIACLITPAPKLQVVLSASALDDHLLSRDAAVEKGGKEKRLVAFEALCPHLTRNRKMVGECR